MFSRIITSEVRKELKAINFNFDGELLLLKFINDLYILRVYDKDKSYIIRYYSGDGSARINNYRVMEKYGIKSVKCDVITSKMVIYEDIESIEGYKFASVNDLDDERVVLGLAKWYKSLHGCKGVECLDSTSYFTVDNIKKIMKNFNLVTNKALVYILENFNNIKLKLNRVNKCLTYGEFSLENLVISEDYKEVFMINFDYVSEGYKCRDIKSVLSKLSESSAKVFKEEYGRVSKDEEMIDLVVGDIIKLYLATKEEFLPIWVKDSLNNLHNGELLKNAKCLVEWY